MVEVFALFVLAVALGCGLLALTAYTMLAALEALDVVPAGTTDLVVWRLIEPSALPQEERP